MYSKFGHHPHPLGYLCAKFHFFRSLHCWASPRRKLCNQSLTHSITRPTYLMPRQPKHLHFGTANLCSYYSDFLVFINCIDINGLSAGRFQQSALKVKVTALIQLLHLLHLSNAAYTLVVWQECPWVERRASMNMYVAMLIWPWPWPNELDTRTWTRCSENVHHNKNEVSWPWLHRHTDTWIPERCDWMHCTLHLRLVTIDILLVCLCHQAV